jgi:DNA-binding response OmpR family regulator
VGAMKRILIVDDDAVLRESLSAALEAEGYKTAMAADGREGLDKAARGPFDLIVLDVVMPMVSGLDVVRKLREGGVKTPIIFLSGQKKKEIDKVLGLEIGGDDYITKPFGVPELVARVHAVLRRGQPEPPELEELAFGDVHVDFKKRVASKGGKVVHLTAREFDLVKLLASHEGDVVTRETILNEVWDYESFPTTRTIDTFMHNLRKKLEDDPGAPKHLITVPWSGYRFVKAPEG